MMDEPVKKRSNLTELASLMAPRHFRLGSFVTAPLWDDASRIAAATTAAVKVVTKSVLQQRPFGYPIPISCEGYPKGQTDKLGRKIVIRRGADARVYREATRPGALTGERLRAIRAERGVGRPPGTVPERFAPPMREAA